MRPMRLVFLEERPEFGGGSERMSLALCRHAVRKGHEAWLVHAQPGNMVAEYQDAGARCQHLPVFPIAVRRPTEALRSYRHLASVADDVKANVLFTSQVNFAPLLVAVGRRGRVVSAVHLGLAYDYPSPVFQAGMRRVDLGVTPSQHTAAEWTRRGWPESSLRVIPNGVETDRFSIGDGREAARQRLGLPAGMPIVAFVGRLVPEKGIATLLGAFARYLRKGREGHLLFAGGAEPTVRERLGERAQAEGLDESAWEIRPATPRPEDVYRAADVVVVPSEWDEPFGLVPLEAASCGTLTIVSNRGVLESFVKPLGERAVFHSGDTAGLADRLDYWLADADRRASSAECLSRFVRTTFDFNVCGDAYLAEFASRVH